MPGPRPSFPGHSHRVELIRRFRERGREVLKEIRAQILAHTPAARHKAGALLFDAMLKAEVAHLHIARLMADANSAAEQGDSKLVEGSATHSRARAGRGRQGGRRR